MTKKEQKATAKTGDKRIKSQAYNPKFATFAFIYVIDIFFALFQFSIFSLAWQIN